LVITYCQVSRTVSDVKDILLTYLSLGGLSGFTSSFLLQPFDLLKTRLQQGDATLNMRQGGAIRSTVRSVVSSYGVLGLWRGTSATLLRNVPGIALYFTSLSQVRGFMAVSPLFAVVRKRDPQRYSSILPVLTSSGNLLAGATTRVAVGFVMNPLSVLKARYEVRKSPNPFSITIRRHPQFL